MCPHPGSCRVCLVSCEHGGGCGAGCFDIAGGGGDVELLLPVPDCVSSGPQSGGDRGSQLCFVLLGSLHVLEGCLSLLGAGVPEPVSFLNNISLVGFKNLGGFILLSQFLNFCSFFLGENLSYVLLLGYFPPLIMNY